MMQDAVICQTIAKLRRFFSLVSLNIYLLFTKKNSQIALKQDSDADARLASCLDSLQRAQVEET